MLIGDLNKMKKQFYRVMREFGINPLDTITASREIFAYYSDLRKIKKQLRKDWEIKSLFPCLHDKSDKSGTAKGHYFHQDLLVASEIFKKNPSKHLDIGSRVDGLVAHIVAFREIEVFDIRPLDSEHKNILFKKMDLMNPPKKYISYSDSISCLHALEYFGLGRYGDNLDIDGYIKGFENIVNMLKKGGTFYFSVPIGSQRIEFNAHRVFSIKEIFRLAKKNGLDVIQFSYVDDSGKLYRDYMLREGDLQNNLNCNFGCGIWEFKKK